MAPANNPHEPAGPASEGWPSDHSLLRRLRGEPTRPFRYVDYGNLATVGRKAAVIDLTVPMVGAVRFWGLAAWLF